MQRLGNNALRRRRSKRCPRLSPLPEGLSPEPPRRGREIHAAGAATPRRVVPPLNAVGSGQSPKRVVPRKKQGFGAASAPNSRSQDYSEISVNLFFAIPHIIITQKFGNCKGETQSSVNISVNCSLERDTIINERT